VLKRCRVKGISGLEARVMCMLHVILGIEKAIIRHNGY
jgi:hypothetical protein